MLLNWNFCPHSLSSSADWNKKPTRWNIFSVETIASDQSQQNVELGQNEGFKYVDENIDLLSLPALSQ